MMKIIITGPQGCGKTTTAEVLKNCFARNKRLNNIIHGKRKFLVRIVDGDGKINNRDKDVYDVVIVCKQEKY